MQLLVCVYLSFGNTVTIEFLNDLLNFNIPLSCFFIFVLLRFVWTHNFTILFFQNKLHLALDTEMSLFLVSI